MKRILSFLLLLLLVLPLTSCGKWKKAKEATNLVKFDMEDGSSFVVELYPEYAPKTVENFQQLVSEGFYDGLTFHRIIEDFMIQGGDPDGDGKSSPDQETIEGEFAENGFTQNTLSHERGVISMARSSDPNSASSQFFIMHKTNTGLDGKYAAFGRVVDGMDTIDALATVQTTWGSDGKRSKPLKPPVIKSVYFVEER